MMRDQTKITCDGGEVDGCEEAVVVDGNDPFDIGYALGHAGWECRTRPSRRGGTCISHMCPREHVPGAGVAW